MELQRRRQEGQEGLHLQDREEDRLKGKATNMSEKASCGQSSPKIHAVCLIRDTLKSVLEGSLTFFATSLSLVPYCVS